LQAAVLKKEAPVVVTGAEVACSAQLLGVAVEAVGELVEVEVACWRLLRQEAVVKFGRDHDSLSTVIQQERLCYRHGAPLNPHKCFLGVAMYPHSTAT
jgi:hypothetical protein